MSSILYTDAANNVSYTTAPILNEVNYDHNTNKMVMWNGVRWVEVAPGAVRAPTICESLQTAIDNIELQIEQDEPNNVTIQDALAEWRSATEKFQVILALAEKNDN